MLQLANPLYYPSAVLIGGITLVLGVRVMSLSTKLILPTSIAATTLTATALKANRLDENQIAKQQLEQEIKTIEVASKALVKQAHELRQEANNLLTQNSFQIDLLVSIQQVCDRVIELPDKINTMAQNSSKNKALLSASQLDSHLAPRKVNLRSDA
jgi:DNA repair exonuclease SbcCD ATPase subunit